MEVASTQSHLPLIEWRRFAVRPLRPYLLSFAASASHAAQARTMGHYWLDVGGKPATGVPGTHDDGSWGECLDNAQIMLATLVRAGWGVDDALSLPLGAAIHHVALANHIRQVDRDYLLQLKGGKTDTLVPPDYSGRAKGAAVPVGDLSPNGMLATLRAVAEVQAEGKGGHHG